MSHSFTNSMNNRNSLLSNSGLNVENLRNVRNECMSGQQYRSAVFWSDKIVSLSNGQTDDVYQQAICFFHLNEFHRAIHCIKSRNLQKTVLSCRHLAAKCHVRHIQPIVLIIFGFNAFINSFLPKNIRKR